MAPMSSLLEALRTKFADLKFDSARVWQIAVSEIWSGQFREEWSADLSSLSRREAVRRIFVPASE
jgi:hypothetical protein